MTLAHADGTASLLVVVLLSLLITRIAMVALVATGLSRSAARFQPRSAFTGAGFTTSEAESVVNHPARRRIVMLLGNAGLAAVVASLMIGFARSGGLHAWWRVLELVGGMAVLPALARRTLRELSLRDEGIAVLGIERPNGEYRGAPSGPARIRPGDTLVLYGRGEAVCALDTRGADADGDAAHERAVLEQERIMRAENEPDEADAVT